MRFHAGAPVRVTGAKPIEDMSVLVVATVFVVGGAVRIGAGARVFTGRIQRGPGEVEPVRVIVIVKDFRLEAG